MQLSMGVPEVPLHEKCTDMNRRSKLQKGQGSIVKPSLVCASVGSQCAVLP